MSQSNSSKQDFLFELGCEELPPKALTKLAESLHDYMVSFFKTNELQFSASDWFATPRRLTVSFTELDTKQQDNSDSVLIKANTTQNCTCEISVIDQNKAISVVIQKFDQRKSSSPSDYGCGLILKFDIGTDKNIWEAQCLVNNSGVIKSIQVNNKMTIKSFTVDGNLKKNEGYCIQVKKGIFY